MKKYVKLFITLISLVYAQTLGKVDVGIDAINDNKDMNDINDKKVY